MCCFVCRSPHPPAVDGVKRLVLCSGKLYYELADKRTELGTEDDVAIVRVEQVRWLLDPGAHRSCYCPVCADVFFLLRPIIDLFRPILGCILPVSAINILGWSHTLTVSLPEKRYTLGMTLTLPRLSNDILLGPRY